MMATYRNVVHVEIPDPRDEVRYQPNQNSSILNRKKRDIHFRESLTKDRIKKAAIDTQSKREDRL